MQSLSHIISALWEFYLLSAVPVDLLVLLAFVIKMFIIYNSVTLDVPIFLLLHYYRMRI